MISHSSTSSPIVLVTAATAVGGIETVVRALAIGLAESGKLVTMVQLQTPGSPKSQSLDSIEHPNVSHVRLVHAARDYRRVARDLRAVLSDFPSSVVHSHGKRADFVVWLAARSSRRPKVATLHGFVANSMKQRVGRTLHELVLRAFDKVVAVSKPLEEKLSKSLGRSHVKLIGNAPPRTTFLERVDAREQLGIPEGVPLIGWVGRMGHEKGLDVFVRSLVHLRNQQAAVVVIGDGPERADVSELAVALGVSDRLRWLGIVPVAATLFSGLDILVLSSRSEGTPMNVLEAIDAGVPVVATAVGGVPDLLEDGGGWLVASESPVALASALDEALGDPSVAKARASVASSRMRTREQSSNWIDAHLSLYHELLRP